MLDNNFNIIEFLQKNEINIIRCRYNLALKLLDSALDASLIPNDIVIYGVGQIGRAFFNKCRKICSIECFLDQNPNISEYSGIPILTLDRIDEITCENFIITPIYDIGDIKKQLLKIRPNVNIISLETLFI